MATPLVRRRLYFYGGIVGIILAANSSAIGYLLRLLQFKPSTVTQWQNAIQGDTLSLIALFTIGLYVDVVIRHDESDRIRAYLDGISEDFVSGLSDRLAQLLGEHNSLNGQGLTVRISELERRLADSTRKLLLEAQGNPIGTATPEECVIAALDKSLNTHPESFPHLAAGIVGTGPDSIIDDAFVTFILRSLPDDDDYIELEYWIRGKFRKNTYTLMLAHGEFRAESRIVSSGKATDALMLIDDKSFEGSLDLISKSSIEVSYRDNSGTWVTEQRPFEQVEEHFASTGIIQCKVFAADLTPPAISRGPCDTSIRVHAKLPSRPACLRWYFDAPTFVHEIQYDVSRLWPDWEMDFTLYPFHLGTEDYTQRAAQRLPVYRMGVHTWLGGGNGVILVWEKIRRRE